MLEPSPLIDKYLDHYAEREARSVAHVFEQCPRPPYRRALIVPAYDETGDFISRFVNHPGIRDTLLIGIINRPCENPVGAGGLRTQALWTTLLKGSTALAQSANIQLRTFPTNAESCDALLIDYCTGQQCLAAKNGVGQARKCGADVALALIRNWQITQPWIYTTDADAWLPDNYFEDRTEPAEVAAIHCGFEHFAAAETSKAQQLYDLGMHYYVGGLAYAGSPYAHYSLGSALIINAEPYAAVRGFPKRAAGEDFYLLNKLAKVGTVKHDASITVRLSERESHRTPFGTGPAIRKIADLENPEQDYAYYHPSGFTWLKLWLATAAKAAPVRDRIAIQGAQDWLLSQWQDQMHVDAVCAALDKLGMLRFLEEGLNKYRTETQFIHQFHGHFDALKTLRFVHELRDHAVGTVNASEVRAWLARNSSDAMPLPFATSPQIIASANPPT